MCTLLMFRLHPKIQLVEGAGGTHVAGHTLLHLDLRCDLSHLSGHEGEPCGTASPGPHQDLAAVIKRDLPTADEQFCKLVYKVWSAKF